MQPLILDLNFWHRSFLTIIMVDHYPLCEFLHAAKLSVALCYVALASPRHQHLRCFYYVIKTTLILTCSAGQLSLQEFFCFITFYDFRAYSLSPMFSLLVENLHTLTICMYNYNTKMLSISSASFRGGCVLSTDCRVREASPGHGVSSSESEGSSHA